MLNVNLCIELKEWASFRLIWFLLPSGKGQRLYSKQDMLTVQSSLHRYVITPIFVVSVNVDIQKFFFKSSNFYYSKGEISWNCWKMYSSPAEIPWNHPLIFSAGFIWKPELYFMHINVIWNVYDDGCIY